jgi:hypothetical protein
LDTLTISGICLAYDFRAVIVTGAGAAEVANRSKWEVLAQGDVTLALGVVLFDRPFIFTPRSIITERHQTVGADHALEWLDKQGYNMPRSEVFGVDVRGREGQVFARDVDIEASPIAVFNYGAWVVAMVEIDPAAAVRPRLVNRSDWTERFRQALKCYRAGPSIDLTDLLPE